MKLKEDKFFYKMFFLWTIKIDYDFCTTLSSFREYNMVQHSKLHQLSKSANDVQNLCKMHYGTY
ncbi:hypothetical protein BpHYR1_041064 [Brachionus plicatilis]|uniref:Uncharacterized protein n=1 Tax=Brachionus plicatilis TaxID=10195 RepID=A0A3M7QWD4_BRAPC|nr:hypothetical protein BpHYR1_041064 [Brachionus plicatilis]